MEDLTYQDVVDEIFSFSANKRKKNLVMHELVKYFGCPHLAMSTIHIAGTNGKGQVAAKVSKALELQGYRVGLYISPHIEKYSERISINGAQISESFIIDFWKKLKKIYPKIQESSNFFEITTLIGFCYFAVKKVDIAIIETGLGGRSDATNVVKPLVSAITTVSYDHIDYLGSSLKDIIWEKAGIIKPKTPVVVGPRACFFGIYKEAKSKGANIVQVKKRSLHFDIENRAVASAILDVISNRYPVCESKKDKGMRYSLSCRFEKVGSIIYDGAHNPDAFFRLVGSLRYYYPDRSFRFVIGMNFNKNIRDSLKHIDKICDHVHFVKVDNIRGAEPKKMAEEFRKVSQKPLTIENSITEAMDNAKTFLKEGQFLVVCGSFFLMNSAMKAKEAVLIH